MEFGNYYWGFYRGYYRDPDVQYVRHKALLALLM